jgi:hypothetical protein
MGESNATTRRKDVDLSEFLTGTVFLTEGERLRFAKQVLLWLALICIAVFIAHGAYPDNQAIGQIFELVKIGALPLVTLVISFYFPATK